MVSSGVTEGQALAYERLFTICKELGRTDEAKVYGRKAVELIRASQKHQTLIDQILPEV